LRPSGADGLANGHFPMSPLAPDEEEIRDVRAGNQEDDASGGQEDPQRPGCRTEHLLCQRPDDSAVLFHQPGIPGRAAKPGRQFL
jgi:hypothetical protein